MESSNSNKWLKMLWYCIFLVGFNGYLDHFPGIFHGFLLLFIFEGLDYLINNRKINFGVKVSVLTFCILRKIGIDLPEIFNRVLLDFQHLYYGEFDRIKIMPFLFNIILFLIFRRWYLTKDSDIKYYILGIFGGGSLLLSLSILQEIKFSLLTVMFVFVGITLIIFRNLDRGTMKVTSDLFLFNLLLLALVLIVVLWSVNTPVTIAWDDLKNYFAGGFGGGKGGLELELPYFSYHSDESRLGGPIQLRDTPVLQVFSDRALYLRGESRYKYTGKGWDNQIISRQEVVAKDIPYKEYPNVEYQELDVEIKILEGSYPLLFAPMGTIGFQNLRGRYLTLVNSDNFLLNYHLHPRDSYSLQYKLPSYPPHYLRENHLYPSDFPLEEYTSLPEEFPQSIIQLAENLTRGYSNNYDKAFAIQRYLRSRDFRYSLNVPYPPEDMDFVEHFLEIKEGYCVHFSTAFVVMARSVGIPARWVKGYFTGNRIAQGEYLVREEHAHAWAEVYFPQVGWVIFETTPGYSTGLQGEREDNGEPQPIDSDEINPTDPIEDPDIDEDHQGEKGSEREKPFTKSFSITIIFLWIAWGYIVFWYRERGATVKERIITLYNNLLFKLSILGFKKMFWETPREFLYREKKFDDLKFFHDLTSSFEKVYYGDNAGEKMQLDKLKKGRGKFIYNLLKRILFL